MTSNLSSFSDEELKKELEQRKKEKNKPPEQFNAFIWETLHEICREYIDYCASDNYCEDNDFKSHF